jgi:hypothetical protein
MIWVKGKVGEVKFEFRLSGVSPALVAFVGVLIAGACLFFVAAFASSAWAGTVGWQVHAVAEPSSFAASDEVACVVESQCDRYQLLVLNAGDEISSGKITLTDTLPVGITTQESHGVSIVSGEGPDGAGWSCNGGAGHATVICELAESIAPGHFAPYIDITVTPPTEAMSGVLTNNVRVEGAGLAPGSATQENTIGQKIGFELNEFAFEPGMTGGISSSQAGAHPWEVTTSFGIPSALAPPKGGKGQPGHYFEPARNFKNVSVELPTGFLGDPLATPRCEEHHLREPTNPCPAETQVGVFGLLLSSVSEGEFQYTGDVGATNCCSAVYNLVPEAGYPAEFGFAYQKTIPIVMYANVVHTGTGYRVRITAPGIPVATEAVEPIVTFFGEPGMISGTKSTAAFLSNPTDCSAEPEHLWSNVPSGTRGTAKGTSARIETEPWGEPGDVQTNETPVYPGLTGCNLLQFNPTFSFTPSTPAEGGTSQTDATSAFTSEVDVLQSTEFFQPATPAVREAVVKLPEGVTVNPPAGEGLEGCEAEGPEGINIGSDEIGARGQDKGDPEATELGEGHEGPGGNNSPYDDGFYHTAPGHCPKGSAIGTVEVFTPLLATRCGGENQRGCTQGESGAPLQGQVFVAEPKCGGTSQPACTEASATDGELFGLYLEVKEAAGPGSIVKLAGTESINPRTGQITASFKEDPQFPFSKLILHLRGGNRAPLATPQACGSFASSSVLRSWAGQSAAGSSAPFSITGCGASTPFNPAFTAYAVNLGAGAFGPFTLAFSRQDGEQDLSGLTQTMPEGLLAMISNVTQCGEPGASEGNCPEASKIGTTTVTAGAGGEPLLREGQVYLTEGFKGAPFGLSIVVPANAGPFHLGNVVVRAAINVNPTTAAATVTSDPFPQSRDGVPFRLRTVSVNINREHFIFNPTNCSAKQITATITAAQGATANVSSPFQITGCQNLPFKPKFTERTQANTSKANGASLTVNITQNPGEANIAKTDVQLPLQLPSRLTTLQKACLEAQFNANPAGCPEGSDIGTATAVTPVLKNPVTGPAYLVSHGGAAFPDVEFVLQGEGVKVILDGKTDIKKGITYSNFESVPDVPITSFEARLPEGPHSALTAYGSVCAPTETKSVTEHVTKRVKGRLRHETVKVKKTVTKPLSSPTTIVGQNGATIKQNTTITVTGCPKPKPAVKKKATAKKHHKPTKNRR